MNPNPYEMAARIRKATAIAEQARADGVPPNATDAELRWEARKAHQREPSPRTLALVRFALEQWAGGAPDPFALLADTA